MLGRCNVFDWHSITKTNLSQHLLMNTFDFFFFFYFGFSSRNGQFYPQFTHISAHQQFADAGNSYYFREVTSFPFFPSPQRALSHSQESLALDNSSERHPLHVSIKAEIMRENPGRLPLSKQVRRAYLKGGGAEYLYMFGDNCKEIYKQNLGGDKLGVWD